MEPLNAPDTVQTQASSATDDEVPLGPRLPLALALGAFFVTVVLNLAALIGVASMFLGAFFAARPLELLGALDEDWRTALFGVVLGTFVFVLSVGWRGLRAFATRYFDAPVYQPKLGLPGPTRLFLGIVAFSFLVLTPIDRLDLYDIDDGKLGSVIVALVVFLALSLTRLITRSGWRLVAWLWRLSPTRPVLANTTLMLATAASVAVLSANGSSAPTPKYEEAVKAFTAAPVEESRKKMEAFAFASASLGRGATSKSSFAPAPATGGGSGPFGGGEKPGEACLRELQGEVCKQVWQRALRANPGDPNQEDHVQNAAIYTCFEKGYRGEKACSAFWLKVQRTRIDAFRHDRTVRSYANDPVPASPWQSPLDDVLRDEEMSCLARALAQLDTRSHRIIELAYKHGWTDKRIAADIGLSEHRTRVLRNKIKKDLKEILEPCR